MQSLQPAVSPATLNNRFRRLVTVDESGTPTKKPAVFDPNDSTWTSEAIQLQQTLVKHRLLHADQHDTQPTQLMSVGMYPQGKSPVGAFDMSGNMYQWCLNEYDDPTNVEHGSTQPHTTRGGAFFTMPGIDEVQEQLSIRHRLRDNPDGMRDDGRRLAVCMRLVCDNPPPETVLCLPLAPP